MKRHAGLVLLTVFAILLSSCSSFAAQKTDDPKPTSTRRPTKTPTSTALPFPTSSGLMETTSSTQEELRSTLDLQNQLVSLGYYETGLIDGVFDSQTEAAIKHFQLINGLPITGLADDALWQVLDDHPLPYLPPRTFPGKIYPVDLSTPMCDDHGMQERLSDLGYIQPGSVEWSSGVFGNETQKALKQFQKDYLFTESGKPDLITWQALFSPALSLDENGILTIAVPWSTNLYTVGSNVVAMDWDGSRLWLAVSEGPASYQNYLLRIDPTAHPADAVLAIRPRECEAPDATIANLIYAGGKIWLLYNMDKKGNPEPMLQSVDVESGVAGNPFKFVSCPDQFCFQAFALGVSKNTLWAAGNDQVYGINTTNGSVKTSRLVGYMASGQMPFDGTCFWYLGESAVQSFNPDGGNCRGENSAYSMAPNFPETDGKQVWTVGYDGTLSQLNLTSDLVISISPPSNNPAVIAYADEVLWIADRSSGSVSGMSTLDGGFGPALLLDGLNPLLMVQESHYLWIYYADSSSVQRLDISGYSIAPSQNTPTPVFTATPTATPSVEQRTLKLETPFMNGDDVLRLQERLIELGYTEVGSPDGVFGPKTDKAVRTFQESNLMEVDGIVGPLLWGLLFP